MLVITHRIWFFVKLPVKHKVLNRWSPFSIFHLFSIVSTISSASVKEVMNVISSPGLPSLASLLWETVLTIDFSQGNVLRIWKKGVPAGTPLVAGHAGICNTIAKHYTQRNGMCQSHQLGIWFNVMICTNQFLHTQIIIIAPKIGDALFDKRNHCESTILELSHFKKRYNDFKEKPWFAQVTW